MTKAKDLNIGTLHPTIWQLFKSREILVATMLAIITLGAGAALSFRTPGGDLSIVLQSALVAVLELILGTSVWAVTSVSRQMSSFRENLSFQMDSFRRDLEIYNTLLGNVGKAQDPAILDSLTKITGNLVSAYRHPLLFEIMKRDLEHMSRQFSEMNVSQTYTVWAQAKSITVQRIFHNYMESLPNDFRYDTVSNLDFWSTGTLMRPLDFLDVNIDAAVRRKVRIRRVFLVEGTHDLTQQEASLLERHGKASEECREMMEVRVRVLHPETEERSHYGNYAICTPPREDEPSLLLEMYHAESAAKSERVFQRMEVVVDPERIGRHQRRFNRLLSESVSLQEFLSDFSGSERGQVRSAVE